jgi:predicted P-loop ATPase
MYSHRRSVIGTSSQLLVAGVRKHFDAVVRGAESHAEFMAKKKAEQDELKDVGGFVGGALNGPRRKAANVIGRDIITLDADNIPAGGTDDIRRRINGLGVKADIYSTAKHCPAAPRLRVLIYTDRTVSADEYEPIARKMAETIDPELAIFDPTTFEVARLMYWPRCSSDSQYIRESYEGPFVSADGLLALYADWRDVQSWPRRAGEASHAKLAAKQGDPIKKSGAIGAFCRTYDVYRAMDAFLPGLYEAVDAMPGRYTYLGGSTTGGAVVYDGGRYLYSHHATDPCGGRLVNAFDLVRLHRFGELDDEAKPDCAHNRLPSFVAMRQLAAADKEVAALMAREDFAEAGGEDAEPGGEDWTAKLVRNASGGYQKGITNLRLMIDNLPELKGLARRDIFSGKIVVGENLPWARWEERRLWGDTDTTALREFLEKWYPASKQDIRDTLNLVAEQRAFHPVRDYLNGLAWDGAPRLDTLFIDYMSASDTPYVRTVTRKSLVAAVKRIMEPGCKYDYMVVFVGKQGRGKSMLIKTLSPTKEWTSDSLTTFSGREGMESVQGKWLIEIPEMHAFDKATMGTIKAFITKEHDYYRAAYSEFAEERPRQCVLFGTTNNHDCLRDTTGNRRFWPMQCGDWSEASKDWHSDLPLERDQIWAEAVVRWRLGEELYLTREQEIYAETVQELHREKHPWEDTIIDFINREVPEDWSAWSLDRRMAYWGGGIVEEIATVPRERVCCREIWAEAFHEELSRLTLANSRVINNVLAAQDGWKLAGDMKCGKPYGTQKAFKRHEDGSN